MRSGMIDIKTKDGVCDSYFAYPSDEQDLPLILFYMDAVGLRQRIFDMVDKIAANGFYVIAPNLFYRTHKAPVVDYDKLLNPEHLPELFKQVMAMPSQLTPDLSKRDVEEFLNYGKKQPQVNPNKVAAVGYCMGGGQVLRAAGNFPGDFKAVASFHAGNLATDAENSPHRWFPTIQAEVYIGHADNDRSMPPEQMEKVDALVKAAHLNCTTELYKGSLHGWTMRDLPAYNQAGEQRHWDCLFDLFNRNLRG